ncbi:MAG: phosphatidate cytidylyltransferase [Methylococcaceae bacterium]|jgi:phosphatidate cytidylyltransferase
MLLKRVITALVLAPLAALAVFQLNPEYFSVILGLLMLFAAWEWSVLIGINATSKRVLYLLLLVLPMVGIYLWTQILEMTAQIFNWPDVRDYSGILDILIVPAVIFWVVIMLLLRGNPEKLLKLDLKMPYKIILGAMIMHSFWMCLSRLKAFYGAEMTMYLLLLIWGADVAAYFVGRRYGKAKLSPEISPGKTVEGAYGAIAAALICGVVLSLIYGFNIMIASDFILLSIMTVLISVYGDLFFSLVKRKRGVKDSGALLPGHGGILDRLDSLIAAVPFFYAGVYLIGRLVI